MSKCTVLLSGLIGLLVLACAHPVVPEDLGTDADPCRQPYAEDDFEAVLHRLGEAEISVLADPGVQAAKVAVEIAEKNLATAKEGTTGEYPKSEFETTHAYKARRAAYLADRERAVEASRHDYHNLWLQMMSARDGQDLSRSSTFAVQGVKLPLYSADTGCFPSVQMRIPVTNPPLACQLALQRDQGYGRTQTVENGPWDCSDRDQYQSECRGKSFDEREKCEEERDRFPEPRCENLGGTHEERILTPREEEVHVFTRLFEDETLWNEVLAPPVAPKDVVIEMEAASPPVFRITTAQICVGVDEARLLREVSDQNRLTWRASVRIEPHGSIEHNQLVPVFGSAILLKDDGSIVRFTGRPAPVSTN